VAIGKLLAATLLALLVGVQALEATGQWDLTLQDTDDETAIVTVALCIGAALVMAAAIRPRLSPSEERSVIVPVRTTSLPGFLLSQPAGSAFSGSRSLSLRI